MASLSNCKPGGTAGSVRPPLGIRPHKRYLLELVQRNVESANIKGPLVGQLAGVLASKDDRLIDSVYSDLRAAGISLPEQVGRSFIVSGYTFGELQADCHVTLSTSEPDKFGFVLIITGVGLSRPLALPPAMCPRLFRYDGPELLNPTR